MAWEFHVLVVANVTATSDELLTALRERGSRGACRFTLLMPREGTGVDGRLAEALEAMRAAGLEHVSGQVGDPDPIVATMELWDPMQFDEIVVSTLPTGSSRWLGLDLPHRLEKLTSVPVTTWSLARRAARSSGSARRRPRSTACCRRWRPR